MGGYEKQRRISKLRGAQPVMQSTAEVSPSANVVDAMTRTRFKDIRVSSVRLFHAVFLCCVLKIFNVIADSYIYKIAVR